MPSQSYARPDEASFVASEGLLQFVRKGVATAPALLHRFSDFERVKHFKRLAVGGFRLALLRAVCD